MPEVQLPLQTSSVHHLFLPLRLCQPRRPRPRQGQEAVQGAPVPLQKPGRTDQGKVITSQDPQIFLLQEGRIVKNPSEFQQLNSISVKDTFALAKSHHRRRVPYKKEGIEDELQADTGAEKAGEQQEAFRYNILRKIYYFN